MPQRESSSGNSLFIEKNMALLAHDLASLLIIVDYNNAVRINDGDNFPSLLLSRLNEILNLTLDDSGSVDFIDLRLYGGWYEDGIFTPAASKISQVLESEQFFPISAVNERSLIRGSIHMPASSLASPARRWTSLFKQGAGTPRLQVGPEVNTVICDSSRDICPIHVLRRFSSGPRKQCPVIACDRTNADVFRQSRQKKVDVMMATDIVAAATGAFKQFKSVAVFSDDTDLYPALADAASLHENIVLYKTRQAREDAEIETLLSAGVTVRMAQ